LIQKLTLVPDEATIVAEEEAGRRYDYGREGFSEKISGVPASKWLDLSPDGPDA
jgi:hypothetical protein